MRDGDISYFIIIDLSYVKDWCIHVIAGVQYNSLK